MALLKCMFSFVRVTLKHHLSIMCFKKKIMVKQHHLQALMSCKTKNLGIVFNVEIT